MNLSQRLGLKISHELAEGTIADADILPVPAMRDDLDMEQRRVWHQLVGATYFYLLDESAKARHHASAGIAEMESFLSGEWRYRQPEEALWQRYRSSLVWSQTAIRLGFWVPALSRWDVFRLLFERIRVAKPDDDLVPEAEHRLVWAMAAHEAGHQQAAMECLASITRTNGADVRLLRLAFAGQASFERLEQFLRDFAKAGLGQRNLYKQQSLVGGYVLHRFHRDSLPRLPSELRDHVIAVD
jgi:hypothetical protein